jgi:hypothetical protein
VAVVAKRMNNKLLDGRGGAKNEKHVLKQKTSWAENLFF